MSPQRLEPPPTTLERCFALAFLVTLLGSITLVLMVPFWFLYEAASYQAIRGHGGVWVLIADNPGDFWFNVAVAGVWAVTGSLTVMTAVRNLPPDGGWNPVLDRIVARWRRFGGPPQRRDAGG